MNGVFQHGTPGSRPARVCIETFEFFRIEFYRMYKICRKQLLVVLKMIISKNSLLQIL